MSFRPPFVLLALSLGLVALGSVTLGPVAPAFGQDPEAFTDQPETVIEEPPPPPPTGPGEERVDLESLFPDSGRLFGWERIQEEGVGMGSMGFPGYGLDPLLYVEYGAEELRYLEYRLGALEIRIELFRTGRSDGAFGLYTIFNAMNGTEPNLSNLTPPENPNYRPQPGQVRDLRRPSAAPITDNYRIYPGQGAEFFKGRVYGRIRVLGEVDDLHMYAFVETILSKIPKDAPRPDVMRALPRPGKIMHSERYIIGATSAHELNFIVPEDLWDFSYSVKGAAARYRYAQGGSVFYDVLAVQYPTGTRGNLKYEEVVRYLNGEPSLKGFPADTGITSKHIVVRDERDETFSALVYKGDTLYLYTHVPNAPLFKWILGSGENISVSGPG